MSGYTSMSDEEKRIYHNAAKKRSRDRKKLKAEISPCETREDYWRLNRTKDVERTPALLAKAELAADQLSWMENGWKLPTTDQDFLSLELGLLDLGDFVEENGFIREYFDDDSLLGDCGPQWAIWRDFWRSAHMIEELRREGGATRAYCLYGIQISLFERVYGVWKQNIRRHKESRLISDAWQAHIELDSLTCYLCRYAEHHGHEYVPQPVVNEPKPAAEPEPEVPKVLSPFELKLAELRDERRKQILG
jgi:hypothetical protein